MMGDEMSAPVPDQDDAVLGDAVQAVADGGGVGVLRCGRRGSLAARAGTQGEIPYRDIQSVRLSYRPMSMQTRRFVTMIWAPGAPSLVIASSSWRSMVEHGDQIEGYSAFVRALHRAPRPGGKHGDVSRRPAGADLLAGPGGVPGDRGDDGGAGGARAACSASGRRRR